MFETSVALALLHTFNESHHLCRRHRGQVCPGGTRPREEVCCAVNAHASAVYPPYPTYGRTNHPEDRCFVRYPEIRRERRRGGKRR